MIIIIITVIGTIIGLLLLKYSSFDEAGATISLFCGLATIVCLILGSIQNCSLMKDSIRIEMASEREALIYRLENYNSADDGKLFSDIAEFNGEIQKSQRLLDNLWVNWFNCSIYNEIEIIDYNSYVRIPIEVEIKNSNDIKEDS